MAKRTNVKPLPARVARTNGTAPLAQTTTAAPLSPTSPQTATQTANTAAQTTDATTTNGSGKRKKKKSLKGKAPESDAYGYDDEEEDGDDDDLPPLLPALEPVTISYVTDGRTRIRTGTRTGPRIEPGRTGLSPELESVHLSTTASLAHLSTTASTRLHPASAAEAELLATADHLTRSMNLAGDGRKPAWPAGFPDHLRSFVRHTVSQLSAGAVGEHGVDLDLSDALGGHGPGQQAMQMLAQQMQAGGVNLTASATVTGKGATGTARYGVPASIPFDTAIFDDPAFTLAMEQAANGVSVGGMSPERMVMYGEYDGGYYSDGMDELDGSPRIAEAQFTLSYEDSVGHVEYIEEGQRRGGRKKRNKSKKKAEDEAPAPVTALGAPASSVPATNLASVPHNRMPAPRPPPAANPPPSSRAAGKQPMSYTQPPAPANPPPPSRRAASKAPITSHAYPHNHAHHHPSPPSSNASAPQKHRPPANGTPQPAPVKNNKIWSTSTTEERERIKEFWLGLGEEERRNLVKIEKEAVLKKMKEQQKHSCMCAVCGRKRCVIVVVLFRPVRRSSFLLVLASPSSTHTHDFDRCSSMHNVWDGSGMRLRKSSRYCTMLITKSLNSTRTTSSDTSRPAELSLLHRDRAPSPAV